MTVTTLVPAAKLAAGSTPTNFAPTGALGVAPMGVSSIDPVLTLEWQLTNGTPQTWPFAVTPRPYGSFPIGVWGKPQDSSSRKVPKGEVIDALNEVQLTSQVTVSPGGPPIKADRLDPPDKRRPLPFVLHRGVVRTDLLKDAAALIKLINDAETTGTTLDLASRWRGNGGASPVELAAFGARVS